MQLVLFSHSPRHLAAKVHTHTHDPQTMDLIWVAHNRRRFWHYELEFEVEPVAPNPPTDGALSNVYAFETINHLSSSFVRLAFFFLFRLSDFVSSTDKQGYVVKSGLFWYLWICFFSAGAWSVMVLYVDCSEPVINHSGLLFWESCWSSTTAAKCQKSLLLFWLGNVRR